MTLNRNLTDPRHALETTDLEAGLKEPVYEEIVIPERFGPVDVLVDDFKLKRFAFVADDYGDWYLKAGPDGPRIGQPGLLANDLLQLFTTRYAASKVVGLHTVEELWWERPVQLGTTVRLEGEYTEKFDQRGQGSVVLEATAKTRDGQTLLRHRGVEIMRTRPGEVGGRGSAKASSGPRVTGEYDTALPLVDALGSDPVVGQGLAPLRKEVTFEQMAVFSRLGEWVLNIHNDLRTARQAGLDVPILQGQQQVCFLAERAVQAFGARWFTGGWLKTKFLRPVKALDVIHVGGAVTGVDADGVDLHLWIRDDADRMVTIAWARCARGR